ncbi:MFS transporter [Streptomyces sp. UNOB3_S3]|uniref:MFS transporter n=1 Tax=Streptomyces sp. UNOB3_S3 TaxID=2871682 RepID=UPI001E4F4D14|nr:MFS transporter [Streptomyces sp. UNOB3_S3]MCC3774032.1 MFS transporter [Streptomyces sp. UNOB3_S3]
MRTARAPFRTSLPLVSLSLGYFLVMLDVTVVTVAVPDIGASLHAGPAALQWCVDGYSTVFAGLLLLGGGLGDRFGHRRVFLWGLGVFVAASAVCGLATTAGALVAGRLAQGAGAAFLVPASLALLRAAHPDRVARARAVAVWGAVASVDFGAGPAVGGLLVAGLDWRAVFWLNLPVGGLAILLTMRHISFSRGLQDAAPGRMDPFGQVLGVIGLVALAGALNEAGTAGWTAPPVLAAAVTGVAALAAFAVVEHRLEHRLEAGAAVSPAARRPLLPPSLFRRRAFSVTAAIGFLISFGYYGMLFLSTLYFRQARGYDALETGLALLPSVCMGLVAAPLLSRVSARTGPYAPMAAGLFLGAAGFLGWLVVRPGVPYSALLFALAATGLGQTITALAATAAVIDAAPADGTGVASAVFNVARQVGSAAGVALFGTVATASGGLTGGAGLRLPAVLAAAAFLVGGVLATALLLGVRRRRQRRRRLLSRASADGNLPAIGC